MPTEFRQSRHHISYFTRGSTKKVTDDVALRLGQVVSKSSGVFGPSLTYIGKKSTLTRPYLFNNKKLMPVVWGDVACVLWDDIFVVILTCHGHSKQTGERLDVTPHTLGADAVLNSPPPLIITQGCRVWGVILFLYRVALCRSRRSWASPLALASLF